MEDEYSASLYAGMCCLECEHFTLVQLPQHGGQATKGQQPMPLIMTGVTPEPADCRQYIVASSSASQRKPILPAYYMQWRTYSHHMRVGIATAESALQVAWFLTS